MLITMERKGTNLITLHPRPEWLTMFRDAGVDLLAYDGAPCSEAAGPLAEAIRRIEANPDDYQVFGPADRERVIEVLQWAAERCARRPAATMRIQIRNA